MGRTVKNLYGRRPNPAEMTLEIISRGIYDVEIVFDTEHYNYLAQWSWCLDRGKGLVYMMDLSLKLPEYMGFKTARVYLRDYILFLSGYWKDGKASHTWDRSDSMEDYRLDKSKLSSPTK